MTVLQITKYEDDSFVFLQHKIRFAGQGFIMQFVTEALCMQELTHQQLRLCILAFNAAHVV
jgi:hypothetical protein